MHIKHFNDTKDNILESSANAIVIPVNCVGTMGKGLAKQAAEWYPEIVPPYQKACSRGDLVPGVAAILNKPTEPYRIILLPTKDDWRKPSEYPWISRGLRNLGYYLGSFPEIQSIAFPALGCGLGELDWDIVQQQILSFAMLSPELDIQMYGPACKGE